MGNGDIKGQDPKWAKLLSTERLRNTNVEGRSEYDARTPFENDYDRVVFSSSFRRLKNKAQVFSHDGHDFIRTRLTHSIEVSAIGRALGEGVGKSLKLNDREVGSLVATTCLFHDVGNPPFGHSGEDAIGDWFKEKIEDKTLDIKDPQEVNDLLFFEGNAQALRIATRTQWSGYDFGMNLTAATLSVLIKYPCSSIEFIDEEGASKALSKFGYFKNDKVTFEEVREKTGLSQYKRHPLTLLLEAADDIAYVTGDIEDVHKKGIVDFETIASILKKDIDEPSKATVKDYLDGSFPFFADVKDQKEKEQLVIQRFTQMAVRLMTQSVIKCFVQNADSIIDGDFEGELVKKMELAHICRSLKTVMERAVYPHVEIAYREQASRKVIHGLLDVAHYEIKNKPKGTLAQSVYSQARNNPRDYTDLSNDYKLALRLTDYVSGMTDTFALAQYQRMNAMGAKL